MKAAALLALPLLLAACGARSLIGVGGSSTGSGGSTSSTGTTSTGSGGSGGAPDACAVMNLVGPPITTLPDAFHHQTQPALAVSTEGDAIALFGELPIESPAMVPAPIGFIAPLPMQSWPVSLDPAQTAAANGGEAFAAAASMTTGLALLLEPTANDSGLALDPSVGPFAPNQGYGAAVPSTSQPADPLFLARGANQYLVGATFGLPGVTPTIFSLMVIAPGPVVIQSFPGIACGQDLPILPKADGVAAGSGFLAAMSNSLPLGQCPPAGPFGQATRLQVVRWSPDVPQALTLGAEIETNDLVDQIALVPRSDGAWLVWQNAGLSAEVPPPIMAQRVDMNGALVGSAIAVTDSSATSGRFAATAIGDRLAVVWPNQIEPGAPVLAVSMLAANGDKLPGAGVPTAMVGLASDRIAALGAPQKDALFVAWSSQPDPNGGPQRFQLVRFDCVGP